MYMTPTNVSRGYYECLRSGGDSYFLHFYKGGSNIWPLSRNLLGMCERVGGKRKFPSSV